LLLRQVGKVIPEVFATGIQGGVSPGGIGTLDKSGEALLGVFAGQLSLFGKLCGRQLSLLGKLAIGNL
jgi:hypothetical protein